MPAQALVMSEHGPSELVRRALHPKRSVVVAACAGSGKTWLLVSRIVRLLLDGVAPGEILAITFTRHAAQEMAARLREWLEVLAGADESAVRAFLLERAIPEREVDAALVRGRSLHEEVLRAQPTITISTFHSWYLQLLRGAPLSAGAVGNLTLTEQISALLEEAWELFAAASQRDPQSAATRGLDALFLDHGLENTRRLLTNFLQHRADWWAHAGDADGAVERALAAQAAALGVSVDADLTEQLLADRELAAEVQELNAYLARNTPTDRSRAQALAAALAHGDRQLAFAELRAIFLTGKGDLRKLKSSKEQVKRLGLQGERRYLELHARLGQRVADTVAALCDQASLRFNAAGLPAGVALLGHYQQLKRDRQVADFADVEWLAFHLLARSDQAISMQFKLDNRYRHILLDEFQDTNPLQWLALKAWFEAAAQAGSPPLVFLVGDPKQAIYRFRRAEARLFDAARDWLTESHDAIVLAQDESRRCAQPVLDVVNRVFAAQPDYDGFAPHSAHYGALPGRVDVLPLAQKAPSGGGVDSAVIGLRDPLVMPMQQDEDMRREREALSLVEHLREIFAHWEIVDDVRCNRRRAATFADVMILVQRRTHLQVYERALRQAGIPFSTSRQGGLLDTLEASDMIALLGFLVSPFDDLKLAHALRSPIFGCTDEDLLVLARTPGDSWWQRLCGLATQDDSTALARAWKLLALWLERADRLPVHDHLDKIYFEGDIERRYAAAVPEAMRAAVAANLRAFLERALAVDSGRYPSLPRFIDELCDLRDAPLQEAPDEGPVVATDNAIRILTVHGAKGLESPIVWLLDAGAPRPAPRGYDVLLDWPPGAQAPTSFSLRARAAESSRIQRAQVQAERRYDDREDSNLLYVAMTRARQALIVSGCQGTGLARSWYQRVRAAVAAARGENDLDPAAALSYGDSLAAARAAVAMVPSERRPAPEATAVALPPTLVPTGRRHASLATPGQRHGTVFHRVMELLSASPELGAELLAGRLGLTPEQVDPYRHQALSLLQLPELRRYFDSAQYQRAFNELSLALGGGEMLRLDRVVEFEGEVWVLDYKTGRYDAVRGTPLEAEYRAQVADYYRALSKVFTDKPIRGALLFSDGGLVEVTP